MAISNGNQNSQVHPGSFDMTFIFHKYMFQTCTNACFTVVRVIVELNVVEIFLF